MADRRTPILTLPDGRAIYGLAPEQRTTIELQLRRYFSWVAGGRRSDPWASGAGKGQRYDTPRVVHGPPVGGYGPGVAAEPDGPDAALLALDVALARLADHQRRLVCWRYRDGVTVEVVAERLAMSGAWCVDETARALARLYHEVHA